MLIDSGFYYSFDLESRGRAGEIGSFGEGKAIEATVYSLVPVSEEKSINIEAID
jgi:hypothetical protein